MAITDEALQSHCAATGMRASQASNRISIERDSEL
jgi:hypothetical protein